MTMFLSILIPLALFCVVAVLFLGIFSMIKGGEFNKKHGNKLMQMRVALQAITILLLALTVFLSQS